MLLIISLLTVSSYAQIKTTKKPNYEPVLGIIHKNIGLNDNVDGVHVGVSIDTNISKDSTYYITKYILMKEGTSIYLSKIMNNICEIFYQDRIYYISYNNIFFNEEELVNYHNYNDKQSYRNAAKKASFELWKNALKKKQSILNNKLKIEIFHLVYSDYDILKGVEIEVENLSDKTIKYITFTITGYNGVKDKVKTMTGKGIGPIEGDTKDIYVFDNFFPEIVQYIKLDKIKIQYMDNTIKTIINPTYLDFDLDLFTTRY